METINNAFYDTLGSAWNKAQAHPIALLRAENQLRNPWIADKIDAYFRVPCAVLDIGCGAGWLTNFLATRGHNVSGVDLSQTSLQLAQEQDKTQSVSYIKADADALPFEKESFDVVCAMDLLEHVESAQQVIAEAARVLKIGGLFFFHTFNRNLWSWLLAIKGVEWLVANAPRHMHIYRLFLTPEEMERHCRSAHLKVVEWVGLRPEVGSFAFWNSLLCRRVSPSFRFRFTPSLKVGYSGVAILGAKSQMALR